ncbi:hypothetical protein HKI87_01g01750 [Chloropicon roscoffensis]|uniref:Uncharacterized protein n=1 Tax=Chloropicon roscoffensis TaxID=1461544 RepID=A0AAX4NYX0_9CHLO
MRALGGSNAANVTAGLEAMVRDGKKPGAEAWLKNCGKNNRKYNHVGTRKGDQQAWRSSVPPFFSQPPVPATPKDAEPEKEDEIEAHRVETHSQVTDLTAVGETEMGEEVEVEPQATTSFRTFIDDRREESSGESEEKDVKSSQGSQESELKAHDLGGGLNLYFPGLSPGLMAEEAALDAHEVSQVTEGSLFHATASPCAPATGPTPSRGATPGSNAGKLKSFVPQDLSQLEVSAATATAVSPPRPLSRTKPHSPREGLGSVSTKVKRTERAISRVQERLQAAERLAMEVPALEDRIRALTEELDEHRRWKDEAVIYKRMATVLQEKVKETEAEALHSHSVVLENMARAFESQQNQQALLESFPVKSQLLSQLQSPTSRMNDAEAASKFSPRRHRNNEFLDEYLSADEQEVGWGTILLETYDRVDRKIKGYDARLNLGVLCGAVGITAGLCSLAWAGLGAPGRRGRLGRRRLA